MHLTIDIYISKCIYNMPIPDFNNGRKLNILSEDII